MIRNINGYFDFGGGTQFETLTELIDHYRENPMVEKNGGTVLHLKYVRKNSVKKILILLNHSITLNCLFY